jgi:hypothetical protein
MFDSQPVARDTFAQLIRAIIVARDPSELDAFEFAQRDIIDDLYNGTMPDELTQTSGAEFEFGEAAMVTVQFAAVILGTLKAATELYKLWSGHKEPIRSLADVHTKWSAQLRAAGLSEEESQQIATRFAAQLADAIKR